MTLRVGLGIGRIVFRALNLAEAVFAAALVVTLVVAEIPAQVLWPAVAVLAVLVAQLAAIRPVLNRRSDRVLAGANPPRSSAHLVYVAAEVVKVALLVLTGVQALGGTGR